MLKASAGGSGKGIRKVEKPEDLALRFRICFSEAKAAFGNGAMYMERVIYPLVIRGSNFSGYKF